MDLTPLSHFPCIKRILSEPLKELIVSSIVTVNDKRALTAILNIYSVFIDTQNLSGNHIVGYTGIDIFNNKEKFYLQLQCLIGFVYIEPNLTELSKYSYSRRIYKTFIKIAVDKMIILPALSFSKKKISNDIKICIEQYVNSEKNTDTLKYYKGWQVEDKEGRKHHLYLAKVSETYGENFTRTIHNALNDYTKKLNSMGIKKILWSLVELFNVFIQIKPTLISLNLALLSQNSNKFFEVVLGLMISENQIRGNDIKHFINSRWLETVNCYTKVFVDTDIFEEPDFPIITPIFKVSKNTDASISTGGGILKKSKNRLLSNIPLSITDDNALDIIKDRIDSDLKHVNEITQRQINKVIYTQNLNKNLESKGVSKRYHKTNKLNEVKVGKENFANTLATFKLYQWDYQGTSYDKFLGFEGQTNHLNIKLNLPLKENVLCFLSQLVIEHPEITPSWFVDWELFDTNNNRIGFKKSGDSYVAISYKKRKGTKNAQTVVFLNKHSKALVEALIEYTALAREWLKLKCNDSWRYMCIYTQGISSSPRRISDVKTKRITVNSQFKALFNSESSILPKNEFSNLGEIINLRPIRSNRALQIYFETLSSRAMSEALGHKKFNPKLLSSYLPDTILDFLNDRWIRIFQNSIIYEAMKDSPHIFRAVDFEEDKLNEFLNNHSLNPLPEHIEKGKKVASNDVNAEPDDIMNGFSEIVITISVPLLQILIAITSINESIGSNQSVPSIFVKWNETATFIIKQLEMKSSPLNAISSDVISLYNIAKENPLCLEKMKRALCL